MMEEKKGGLIFNYFDVIKILFERGTSAKEYSYNVAIENVINNENINPNQFEAYFFIKIGSNEPEKPLTIQIEAIGHFELFGEILDDVIDNYKNISAPSIVYPYIRAFLSNLTLQAGLNPINLPPINFASKQILNKDINTVSISE